MEDKFDFFNGHDVFTDHFLDGDEEEMRPSDSDRIQNLRRRVEALELAMSKLGMQVGPETGKNDPKRKPVPQEKLEEYIHEAMLKGDNELGVFEGCNPPTSRASSLHSRPPLYAAAHYSGFEQKD